MSTSDLSDAVAGINDILAAGNVDIIFAPARTEPGVIGVAHETHDDDTDTEVAVVHAPDYEQALIAMHEALIEAGYDVAVSV